MVVRRPFAAQISYRVTGTGPGRGRSGRSPDARPSASAWRERGAAGASAGVVRYRLHRRGRRRGRLCRSTAVVAVPIRHRRRDRAATGILRPGAGVLRPGAGRAGRDASRRVWRVRRALGDRVVAVVATVHPAYADAAEAVVAL